MTPPTDPDQHFSWPALWLSLIVIGLGILVFAALFRAAFTSMD